MRQWLLLVVIFVAGTWAAAWNEWLWRADHVFYDAVLPERPAPQDIVIVAIDDASLSEIGRWPWRRAVHAALVERLTKAGARAIGLDLILSEPDQEHAGSDAALARAIAVAPATVLPVLLEFAPDGGLRENRPAPAFGDAAALGHVHVELDRDGIARSVFLREGLGEARWPHFALALLSAAGLPMPSPLPGARGPAGRAQRDVWVRDYRILVPYAGPPGHYPQVSYADVLRGELPPQALRGKLVLVGATAQGLGDAYPTPRSGEGRAMPGVEIAANVLDGLRQGVLIEHVGKAWEAALQSFVVLLAFGGFLWLTPRGSLVATAALMLSLPAASLMALRFTGFWFAPSVAIVALALAYPVWSWRRLETAQRFLEDELDRLAKEPALLGHAMPAPASPRFVIDKVQTQIELVRTALGRFRDFRKFIIDAGMSLPDAALAIDSSGRIVLANARAQVLLGTDPLLGRNAHEVLQGIKLNDGRTAVDLLDQAPCAQEAHDMRGRDVYVRLAPLHSAKGQRIGSIVQIADISALKEAEYEREDLVRFMSHDLRGPQSSLLALARLQRDAATALGPAELADRLEALARRALTLTDAFIDLARARARDPGEFVETDLRDAALDAVDEVWFAAQARQMRIETAFDLEAAPVRGDRQLIARAICNLLHNAVKYGGAGTPIRLEMHAKDSGYEIVVIDQGPGMDAQDFPRVFERYVRAVGKTTADPGGTGLGLALVKAVAAKHGARIDVSSTKGKGSRFVLWFPACTEVAAGKREKSEG